MVRFVSFIKFKMGINFKQRIFNEWIIYSILLLVSFVTLLVTFILFLDFDCCKYTKIIVQLILILCVITILFYLSNFSKKITTDQTIDFISRFSYLKNVLVLALFISFILLAKIVFYTSLDCKKDDEKTVNVECKTNCTHSENFKRDTIIIQQETCKHHINPIPSINPVIECDHSTINKQYYDLEGLDEIKSLIETNNDLNKSMLSQLDHLKKCSIIENKTIHTTINNYSLNKLKIKNKKGIHYFNDSVNMDSLSVNFNAEKIILKNKKYFVQ